VRVAASDRSVFPANLNKELIMARPSTCWPGDDLDGYTEITYPPVMLQAYWDAEILDTSGIPSPRILRVGDPFDVRFRVELAGPAWQCMSGDWVFDVRFDEQGGPDDFKLSSLLPANALTVKDWKGCDRLCVELQYTVPPNTLKDTVYELTASFRLYCCGKPAAIVGFEPKEEYQWYA
jgi:hypothetical protein